MAPFVLAELQLRNLLMSMKNNN